MLHARLSPHLSPSNDRIFIVFCFCTRLFTDYRNSFCRRQDVALYTAVLSSMARTMSSFHQLSIKRADCPSPVLRDLWSPGADLHHLQPSKQWVLALLYCDSPPVKVSPLSRSFDTSRFFPIVKSKALWILTLPHSHSKSYYTLLRLHLAAHVLSHSS